ncbi:MucR family transcriptional regulator [Devosia naphthalenivorans]|uniref:MucR family transcriptional regulator n=1 Tax=Devosia naphthalenivorans TaxID=2082392 RepID=UPI000D33AAD8|nr:MucR family transcriptional regulator [Devosia naphthalenivorans]
MNETAGAATGHEQELIELSTEIVAAYVSHNALSPSDLPKLIAEVHGALRSLSSNEAPVAVEELKPAVPIRKSVAADYIICLEDGKKFKSLKRHLRTHYNLSPEEYREKWGLPADYPMVAPSYSATRSKLAKDNGLGRKAA